MDQSHPGARLRDLMNQGVVAAPGAFNALVAKAVARAGFQACYVSGAATSVAAGVPDVGILTLEHFCRVIREVADGSGLPVIADADTGFGEAEMVRRTVIEYHRAGAAGLHIEDQVFPKRCGHLDGKALLPADDFARKVTIARAASDKHTDGSFIVCARTDAAGVTGIDDAIDRAKRYIDAGAHMIFPEGLHSEAEFDRFAKAINAHNNRTYLLANMTEFGKTPIIPLKRFDELGYHCVIWPVSTLRSAMGEVQRLLANIKRDGTVTASLDNMLDRKNLYRLLGYTPGTEWQFPGTL